MAEDTNSRPTVGRIICDSELLYSQTRDLPNPYLRRQREAADALKSAIDSASVQELVRLARPKTAENNDDHKTNRSNAGLSLEIGALFNLAAAHVSEELHMRRKIYLQDFAATRRKAGVKLQKKASRDNSADRKDKQSAAMMYRLGLDVILVLVEGHRSMGNHTHADFAWSLLGRLENQPAGWTKYF